MELEIFDKGIHFSQKTDDPENHDGFNKFYLIFGSLNFMIKISDLIMKLPEKLFTNLKTIETIAFRIIVLKLCLQIYLRGI